MMPRMVMVMVVVGMVIGGVFVRVMMDELSRPARMIPMARRVIGLHSVGLFSFIGASVGMQVGPAWASRVVHRL